MPSPEHHAVVEMLRSAPPTTATGDEAIALTRQGLEALGAAAAVPPDVAVEPVVLGGVACERS